VSLEDYRIASRLEANGVQFLALILAALRRRDPTSRAHLARAFPEVEAELQARERTPGGLLPSEREWDAFERPAR